ncbi:MAG: hypothetical protein ACRDKT_07355 [Actinomycetota bacterium]
MLRHKVWPAAIAGGSAFLVFAVLWAVGVSTMFSLFVAGLTFFVVYPVALVNERKFADRPAPGGDPFYDRDEELRIRRGRGRYP